jgi:maltose alpha-D-glucosyltransferase/alpha-amylase
MFVGEENPITAQHPVLMELITGSSWYTGNNKPLIAASFAVNVPLYGNGSGEEAWLSIVRFDYSDGKCERYFFPYLLVASKEKPFPQALPLFEGQWIADALLSETFRKTMYERALADAGHNEPAHISGQLHQTAEYYRESELLTNSRSNSAFVVNGKYFCKVFRKIHPGQNTEAEVLKHLMHHTSFKKAPYYYTGWEVSCGNEWEELDILNSTARYTVMAVLQKIENRGSGWNIFTEYTSNFLRLALDENLEQLTHPEAEARAEQIIREQLGLALFTKIEQLAETTAEMHRALCENPGRMFEFATEPLSENKKLLIAGMQATLQERSVTYHKHPMHLEYSINLSRIELLLQDVMKEAGQLTCIRIHGDYHLGQLLWNGEHFTIIDFEGERGASFDMRRAKYPVHKDLAGMLRSFSLAAQSVLLQMEREVPGITPVLKPFASMWVKTLSRRFMTHYHALMKPSGTVYQQERENNHLLDFFMMGKMMYELDVHQENPAALYELQTDDLKHLLDDFVS